jgi:hypothetical protein
LGTRASNFSHVAVVFEQPRLNQTRRDDEIIKEDRCVKLEAIAAKFGIRHNAIYEIIGRLGYRKICVRLVPCLLTEDHKVQ